MSLNTYAGWHLLGRAVLKGEKANSFGRLEDGTWIALFEEEQTAETDHNPITMDDVLMTRSAEEHQAARAAAQSSDPKIIVEVGPDGKTMKIWVGSSKRGLELVRNSGFRFDPRLHRWIGKRDDPDQVVAELRSRKFNVTYRPVEAAS